MAVNFSFITVTFVFINKKYLQKFAMDRVSPPVSENIFDLLHQEHVARTSYFWDDVVDLFAGPPPRPPVRSIHSNPHPITKNNIFDWNPRLNSEFTKAFQAENREIWHVVLRSQHLQSPPRVAMLRLGGGLEFPRIYLRDQDHLNVMLRALGQSIASTQHKYFAMWRRPGLNIVAIYIHGATDDDRILQAMCRVWGISQYLKWELWRKIEGQYNGSNAKAASGPMIDFNARTVLSKVLTKGKSIQETGWTQLQVR